MRRALAAVLVVALLTPTVVAQSEDTAEPRIEWSSPWERGPYEGVPEGDGDGPDWTASDGTLELQATIHDESAIESVTIRRTYKAEVNGDQERDVRAIRLGGVEEIDETVHAGTLGRTYLKITVRDAAGNAQVARVVVNVKDTAAPTADLSARPAGDGWVRISGTVTDDTQVDRVRLHAVSATKIVSPQQGSLDITDNSARIDTRVQAPPKGVDGAVTVDLVDRGGNMRTIRVPVNASTTPTATATPTATPAPTATATPTPTETPQASLETIAPTATATPPATAPAAPDRGGGISVFGVLKLLVGVALLGAGVVVVANVVTGGRY